MVLHADQMVMLTDGQMGVQNCYARGPVGICLHVASGK